MPCLLSADTTCSCTPHPHPPTQHHHSTPRSLFLPNAFYDTADRLGVLIYHDLMFGQPWNGGTGGTPVNSPTQTAEIQVNTVVVGMPRRCCNGDDASRRTPLT